MLRLHLTGLQLHTTVTGQGGSNGSIVFVSSVMGHGVLFSGAIPYAMSKAAISHMGKSMARELAPHHINVNIVLPGYTDTPGLFPSPCSCPGKIAA
jgi:NAD(P)-dependent dehydrogenase (short-subunit alcohol dehydrogenase family)